MSSYNLPLLSLVANYALAMIPRCQAAALEVSALWKSRDNRNPKGSEFREKLKAKLTAPQFRKWERCENCHRNALENMPLYVGAIFAGLYAQLRSGESLNVTWYAGAWLVLRSLYTLSYTTVDTQNLSYLRSILYHLASVVCYTLIIRSAYAAGPE